MAGEVRTIKIAPGSDLGRLLAEADVSSVILERDGDRYRLIPMKKENERPTPEQVVRSIDGIKKAAGSWHDMDAEAFKAYIAERRRTANRPSIRL